MSQHTTFVRRRDFLKASAAVVAAGILPASVRAAAVNEKLRTAHIGVGGKGRSDLSSMASHSHVEVAALCDVDANPLAKAHKKHPKARTFRDFREMLSTLKGKIDAVVVSTPDHTHAPAAMAALNMGLPVYCQKPLTHEVFEARQLRLVSEKNNIPTQMGIQAHSSSTYRRAVAMIQNGVIGQVRQVHAWSFKNWGYDGGPFKNTQTPPERLEWNLWLGTAEKRPYVPRVYHPRNWRKLIDFGTGTLGDMGVHIFDSPYAALGLTAPTWARTTCRKPTGIGHPEKNVVEYEFPGTKYTTGNLRWTWYDGANAPPDAREFGYPSGQKFPRQGSLLVGEEGSLLLPHVGEAQVFSKGKFLKVKAPSVRGDNHYHQWVDACLGKGETSAPFRYGGPLTEALLLGVVANRFPGKRLMWDAEKLQVTNEPAANKLLRRDYRDGFEVENL